MAWVTEAGLESSEWETSTEVVHVGHTVERYSAVVHTVVERYFAAHTWVPSFVVEGWTWPDSVDTEALDHYGKFCFFIPGGCSFSDFFAPCAPFFCEITAACVIQISRGVTSLRELSYILCIGGTQIEVFLAILAHIVTGLPYGIPEGPCNLLHF